MKASLPALCTAALLCACAPVTQRPALDEQAVAAEARKQRELAFRDLAADEARLYRIAYPILAHGAPLCEQKVRRVLGVRLLSLENVPQELREAAGAVLGLAAGLQVVQVALGSPAEKAGLRERDVIVALEGVALPAGREARARFSEILAAKAEAQSALALTVRRGAAETTLAVTPRPACDFPVGLHLAEVINAFADGRQVMVTRGMLRFVRDDLELAVVIGHELAHNTMKHIEKQTGNALLGTLLDLFAASRGVNTQGAFGDMAALVYSREFEAEADYVGLYFTARAGHDIEAAPNFWRRMAAANPGGIQRGFASSHPSTPERFLALEKVVEEIRAKRAGGKPLAPELAK